VTELVLADGPLDDERLGWVAALYGQADPRWAHARWVRHLCVDNPSGAAVHAFAIADDGRAVGHCCVLPMRTRVGDAVATSGKIEGLFIEPDHRGDLVEHAGRPTPLAMAMIRALYDFAEQRGMGLLHSYSEPALGRLHRIARTLPITVPMTVRAGVLRPALIAANAPTPRDRVVRRVAGTVQGAWASALGLAARATLLRPGRAVVRDASGFPPAALAVAPPPPGRWLIDGVDAPGWYTGSPALRVVALPGPGAPLALVRWPGAPGEAALLVAADLAGGGLRHALALVAAVAAAVRRAGAPQLRWMAWDGPGTALLDRACRLLGFLLVERELTLYCRASAPPFDDEPTPVPTPFLSAIF
jgi:hypothetical protein